ncbi:MAG: elongation factor 4 [Lentisphaeria bacterium]|nr:translation elongation factor 4 [Lentisphaeria bacterium]NQZ67051.1 elongation factor 4 [Lentisphaeria bacterium]
MDIKKIRNFSIIAHIDHGKSTLADRFIEYTQVVDKRDMEDRLLDDMDLEKERGITIKSHPVRLEYKAKDGETYILNLIDTPGHVDFAYEVSRSLAACEGALLLIDASQGVQAQTVANVNLAMKQDLAIIPVINKIDLASADIDMCCEQLEEILTIPSEEAVLASSKQGIGIEEILEAIVERIPHPEITGSDDLKALIFDSVYDKYRGVINYIRLISGSVQRGTSVRFYSNNLSTDVKEVGFFEPNMVPHDLLTAGSVGYIIPNIKSAEEAKMGDTISYSNRPCDEPLPGFQEVKPMVFSGIYPVETSDYEALKQSMAKLRLNDAAFQYTAETSAALGFGFRCGFLGLLHMEIIQERLRREYDMDIIATYPSVIYHVYQTDGTFMSVENPLLLPDPVSIDRIEEPIVKVQIMSPGEYMGGIMNLILEKRGIYKETLNVDHLHILIKAEIPLHEIVIDFHDKLKSITKGYGSMDYEPLCYRAEPLVKLEMQINQEPVDAFATIVHSTMAESRGRHLAERLKEVIPKHLFKIAVQATIGGKVVARETVNAMRKDVTAKCYGGDITRKRKLLEKQKEGKKKMKAIGKVNLPQDVFVKILQSGD